MAAGLWDGNLNKKYFDIAVYWEVFDTIQVQADTLEEALAWSHSHVDELPLGCDPQYVDGSYEVDDDSTECINDYNKAVKIFAEGK